MRIIEIQYKWFLGDDFFLPLLDENNTFERINNFYSWQYIVFLKKSSANHIYHINKKISRLLFKQKEVSLLLKK